MVWPVVDSNQTRMDLMAEAQGDLRAEYELLGLRPVSVPNFKFGLWRGKPALLATVAVVQLPQNPEAWAG